ncbi:MAG: hypothetical protein WBF34_18685 [Streptosporangiaceae bacterium]|jgi:hypothetical protein
MSYDPSHRRPPRQERWPQATPPGGWPSYRDGDAYRDAEQADSQYAAGRQGAYPATTGYRHQGASGGPGDRGYWSAVATDTYPPASNGYGPAASYDGPGGYGDGRDGYDWTGNGYGGNGYGGNGYGGNGYGGAGNANGNDYGSAGNGNGYGTGGYADAGDTFDGTADRYSRTEVGYGQAIDEYMSDASDYDWSENGYGSAADGYGSAADGYGSAVDGYAGAPDGYAGGQADFASPVAYLGPGSYIEPGLADPRLADPGLADPMLAAPDVGVDPYRWQADQDLRREARRRGLAVGAVTGFLAVAVAIGVSTLVAGFVRPQASPMSAMGSVFIDRIPAALKNVMVQHFGTTGRTVLLLGMYAAIAVLAVGIGVLARRAAAPAVAGLAAFSLLAAFVTVTRPGGHMSYVAPAVIGGIAGVAALLWLVHASTPTTPAQYARGGARRRPR